MGLDRKCKICDCLQARPFATTKYNKVSMEVRQAVHNQEDTKNTGLLTGPPKPTNQGTKPGQHRENWPQFGRQEGAGASNLGGG